ncbi:MAG: hypothetical protein RR202_01400 [Bacteroidales bacterium]
MKKMLIISALAISSFSAVKAQDGLQLGANLGPTMGLSLKYNFSQVHAFEGIAGYNIQHDGPSFKFMYQYNIALVDALRLYFGAGIHMGGYHLANYKHDRHGDFAFGLVPTVGLDYSFRGAPVAIGFGYEPAINFTTHNAWDDVAFKVRYKF